MSAKADFIGTVAAMLTEPRPRPRPPKQFRNWGGSQVGQALMTFDLAVEFILIAEHAAAVAAWKHRQQRLAGWQETLSAEQAPMTLEELAAVIHAAGDVDRKQLDTVMFGTRHGEALLDDLTDLCAAATRQYEEGERKDRVLMGCRERVAMILRRCEQRRAEINTATAARFEPLPASDDADRDAVLADAHNDLMVVFSTTSEHLNAQTRRVLNLNPLTATTPLADFWAQSKALIPGLSEA